MATSLVVKCICLSEQPQGIRPGPNAPIRVESDPKCPLCGGEGVLAVKTSFDPPPIPVRTSDWSAWVEGTEDENMAIGYGGDVGAAVENLMCQLEEAL